MEKKKMKKKGKVGFCRKKLYHMLTHEQTRPAWWVCHHHLSLSMSAASLSAPSHSPNSILLSFIHFSPWKLENSFLKQKVLPTKHISEL